jgi:transcription antitermination factor NusG
MPDWVVAVARYQREVSVGADLTAAGYVPYQPRWRERIVRRGKRTWVERMLLGRYILVQYVGDCVQWLSDLTSIRSVQKVLSVDERPLVVRNAEVTKMMGREVRGFVPIERTPDRGSRGRVTHGAFAGQPAQFHSRDDERWTDRVMIEAFGQLTQIELPLGGWEAT